MVQGFKFVVMLLRIVTELYKRFAVYHALHSTGLWVKMKPDQAQQIT